MRRRRGQPPAPRTTPLERLVAARTRVIEIVLAVPGWEEWIVEFTRALDDLEIAVRRQQRAELRGGPIEAQPFETPPVTPEELVEVKRAIAEWAAEMQRRRKQGKK